ncbi:hypothetical protein BJY52DRAFT_209445 [Lactarius psammicola]|nr:hypothetical protein BJY52DRAFT_209445 [Lactarius psammicola]
MLEPSSYPFCNIPGHHPHSTHHIRDVSSFTTFVHTALHDHDNSALVPFFHASSPDTPPSSAHTPLRIDEKNLTDVPPFDDNISVPLFLQPVDQTTTESCRIPATSPNPVITHATHESIDTSTKTMRPPTPDPSASNPPPKSNASTFPPDVAVVPHTINRRTPPDDPDVSSSPPTAVLDDMFPIGPLLSSDSPVTGSDHVSSSPASHSPLLAPVAPDPSCPLPSSAPDLGATSGEGGVKVALHKERDALDAPSAAPDIPPQSPSPSSVTDIAIAGVSWCSLGAENTGDHPPYPSHGQYDIV